MWVERPRASLLTPIPNRFPTLAIYDKNENFFMTYGDGLCSINLDSLTQFHISHKKIATVTAVHPPVRFGELEIKGDDVTKFEEKPINQASKLLFVVPVFPAVGTGNFTVLDAVPLATTPSIIEVS